MAKIYDALIIGAGPAGLSVALGLGRIHRSCAVFSNSKFRNRGAHHAHSILTRDHTPPETLRAIGRQELEKYSNTETWETTITRVRKGKVGRYDGFIAEDEKGQTWQGRTLVMASGTRDILPDIPGYAENWPENIYQCLFCDGHERADLKKAVLALEGFDQSVSTMASLLHFMGFEPGSGREPTSPPKPSLVTIFTNGQIEQPSDGNDALETCFAHGISIEERPIIKFVPNPTEGMEIHLLNQDSTTESVHVGFAFHRPAGEPVAMNLIKQLDIDLVDSPFGTNIDVKLPFHATNIPGIFACGDVSTMGKHTTYAMFSGTMVAGAVAHHCCQIDDAIALSAYRQGRL